MCGCKRVGRHMLLILKIRSFDRSGRKTKTAPGRRRRRIDAAGVVFIAENGGGAAVRLANPGADHADKFGYASAAGLTVHPPAGEDDE